MEVRALQRLGIQPNREAVAKWLASRAATAVAIDIKHLKTDSPAEWTVSRQVKLCFRDFNYFNIFNYRATFSTKFRSRVY